MLLKKLLELLKRSALYLLKILSVFLIGFYRFFLSPYFGGNCRFQPSCSEYAEQALKSLDTTTAIKLIFKRVLSCHPFGRHGYDPIPTDKVKK